MKKLFFLITFFAAFSAMFAQSNTQNEPINGTIGNEITKPQNGKAILQREIAGGDKVYSTLYFSKYHEKEGYFYFVNELKDEKGLTYENVKKVPKENVYLIKE